jgi:SNF2 family DNA or RNA helicase
VQLLGIGTASDSVPSERALRSAHLPIEDEMQRELEVRRGMARKGLVLSMLTRIKQICNHPASLDPTDTCCK